MNYINRFQNSQALSVSVGKNYSEDQLIYISWITFTKVEIYRTDIKPLGRVMKKRKIYWTKIFIYYISTDWLFKYWK